MREIRTVDTKWTVGVIEAQSALTRLDNVQFVDGLPFTQRSKP